MPSDIYWGGLWDWGLRRLPLGLGEYAQRAAALGRYRAARDDDDDVTDTIDSMWAPLPDPPKGFLDAEITFELSREEALAIVENVQRKQPGTLLAWLCAQPDVAADCSYPWDVPGISLPGRVAEVLRHARCFSELTTGPQHAYNALVARRAHRELGWDTARLEESQLGNLRGWGRRWSRGAARNLDPGLTICRRSGLFSPDTVYRRAPETSSPGSSTRQLRIRTGSKTTVTFTNKSAFGRSS